MSLSTRLCSRLRGLCRSFSRSTRSDAELKNVILCPGQGSQYVGMLQQCDQSNVAIRNILEEAKSILGYDVVELCKSGPVDLLRRTIYCQPIVVVSTLIAYEALKASIDKEWQVHAVAGYSVGEISSLVLADVIDLPSALRLIVSRAEAMDSASALGETGMVSVTGLPVAAASEMCEELSQSGPDSSHYLQVAIDMFPQGVVVGGSKLLLNKVLNKDHAWLSRVVQPSSVAVSGAFHTSYMRPALSKYAEALSSITFRPPKVPVYCNLTGRLYCPGDDFRLALAEQIVRPVQWRSCILDILHDTDVKEPRFYEIGPGNHMRAILGKFDRKLVRNTVNVSV